MTTTASIIIPTKGRPTDLQATVGSIFLQTLLPIQLIIVDQSEGEESRQRVQEMFRAAPQNIRDAIRLDYVLDAKISSAAAARNVGMQVAQGNIWLFLDDDVVLEGNFLKELLTVYQRLPDACGVSGIITNYPRPAWSFRVWASVFVRGVFHDERQPIYWRANQIRDSEPIPVRKFTGALMSFRAEKIRGLRFYGAVSDGEDTDFCSRLGQKPVLLIAPRARLAHNKSPIGRSQGHWLRRFARENYYQYFRNWKKQTVNRILFVHLNLGCTIVAVISGLLRSSYEPMRAFLRGAREGRNAAEESTLQEERLGEMQNNLESARSSLKSEGTLN